MKMIAAILQVISFGLWMVSLIDVCNGTAFMELTCKEYRIPNSTYLQFNCKVPAIIDDLDFSAVPVNRTAILTMQCSKKNTTSHIASTTFHQFHRLTILIIRQCDFEELPEQMFQGLKNLQSLRILRSNRLKYNIHLPLHVSIDLHNLTALRLEGLSIHTIPESFWSNLENVQSISFSLNKLTDLNWMNDLATYSSNVTSVDISNNFFTELPFRAFAALPSLLSIAIRYSYIQNVHEGAFLDIPNLSWLTMEGNDLSQLSSPVFQNLTQLQFLDISVCNISILPSGIFSNLNKLQILKLTRNKISFPDSSRRPFINLNNLRVLSMSANNITFLARDLFQGLRSVTILDLSYNNFFNVSSNNFVPVENSVQEIDVSNSNLTSLDLLQNFSSLKSLYASGNGVRVLSSEYFKHSKHTLETIELTRASLTAIVQSGEIWGENAIFASFSQLKNLNLHSNMIDRFDYFMIPNSLKYLDLSINRINLLEDRLSLRFKKKIIRLSISQNNFQELNSHSFSPSLKTLTCSVCNITIIQQGTFGNLLHLAFIKFLDSKIFSIARFAFSVFPGKPTITPTVYMKNSECAMAKTQIVSKIEFPRFMSPDVKFKRICQLTTYCQSWKMTRASTTSRIGRKKYLQRPKFIEFATLDCGSNNLTSFVAKFMDIDFTMVMKLYLDGNYFGTLTNDSLSNYTSLEVLHLNNSHILSLESGVFSELVELKELYLDQNEIQLLHFNQFKPLGQLTILSLKCNKISWINYKVFMGLKELHTLHLDDNMLEKLNGLEFFEPVRLQNLTLSNNNMSSIRRNSFLHLFQLTELHLEHNSLTKFSPRFLAGTSQLSSIFLNDNKFESIQNYTFAVSLKLQNLYLQRNLIKDIGSTAFLHLKRLTALHLEENKLKSLNAGWFRDLTDLTDLHLSYNELTEIHSTVFDNVVNLAHLLLDNNSLRSIDANAFIKLKHLNSLQLHNNQLTYLAVWELPDSLENVSLRGNDFTCDCAFLIPFRDWITGPKGSNKVSDIDYIFCKHQNGSKSQLPILQHVHMYCETSLSTVVILAIAGGSFVTIIIVFVLTYMYRLEMQVWLYSRYGLRLFYKDAQADVGKVFHAFISYSSDDEVFVAENLVRMLEPEFRLCVHGRDFPVGAYITDTVCEVVEKSCRTLLVLSNNFLNSEWCRFEFKIAHHQTLKDRCCRLIVILMDDVDLNELDKELKVYLKTNTYLQWGDRFFWEKLRFAMPNVQYLEEQNERQPLLVQ